MTEDAPKKPSARRGTVNRQRITCRVDLLSLNKIRAWNAATRGDGDTIDRMTIHCIKTNFDPHNYSL